MYIGWNYLETDFSSRYLWGTAQELSGLKRNHLSHTITRLREMQKFPQQKHRLFIYNLMQLTRSREKKTFRLLWANLPAERGEAAGAGLGGSGARRRPGVRCLRLCSPLRVLGVPEQHCPLPGHGTRGPER